MLLEHEKKPEPKKEEPVQVDKKKETKKVRKPLKNGFRTNQLCPVCIGGKLIAKCRRESVPFRVFEPQHGTFTIISEFCVCDSCRTQITLAEQIDRNAAQVQRERARWERKQQKK